MPVERTHETHQTRYELHGVAALTYTAEPSEPATWRILLPGPDGTEDVYATRRFGDADAEQLRTWLASYVDEDSAAELAGAVDAAPPPQVGWETEDQADDSDSRRNS
jgi:hypothetical protein